MLRSNRKLYRFLLTALLIVLIPGAAAAVWSVFEPVSLYSVLTGVLYLAALGASFLYILRGFSKKQARAYILFVFCYALGLLNSLFVLCAHPDRAFPLVLLALIFILLILIALEKDLGRPTMFLLCGLIAGLSLIALADQIFSRAGTGNILRAAAALGLSLMLSVITLAKYTDKAARGRE